MHNLKVCVNADDFSGAIAIELVSMNVYLVAKLNKV